MIDQIQKMYDELYKSKVNDITKAKNEALGNIDKQELQMKDDIYAQRNQAALDDSQARRSTRDMMAHNNLLGSGENVDAMLRNNTNYSNRRGGIDNAYTKYRNEYANARNTANANYTGDVNALRGDIEYKKMQDIMAYQEKLRQEALARSRSGGGSSGGGSYSNTDAKNDVRNEVLSALRGGNPVDLKNTKDLVTNAYHQGLITDTDYKNWFGNLENSVVTNTNAQYKIDNGLYGYSTARR